jgi:hypothetical protein
MGTINWEPADKAKLTSHAFFFLLLKLLVQFDHYIFRTDRRSKGTHHLPLHDLYTRHADAYRGGASNFD